MKRLLSFLAAGFLALLTACELIEEASPFNKKRSETDPPSLEKEVGKDTSVFITGVCYPEGYDWKSDTSHSSVECSLVVYSDGKLITETFASEENLVSPEMDMHRVAGGHLYTDFSTVDETIIKKDGKYVFSWSGREVICGFLVKDGSVWTLGLDRSGTGITLRKDGTTIFEDKEGIASESDEDSAYPTGALYEDEEDICFSYWRGLGTSKSWFIVKNGQAQPVDVPTDLKNVYDVRVIDGLICLAGDITRVKENPILVIGSEKKAIGPSETHTVNGCRIRKSGDRIYIKSNLLYAKDKIAGSMLSSQNSRQTIPGRAVKVTDFWQEGDSIAYVTIGDDNMAGTIVIDGSKYNLNGRYRLMTRRCGILHNGHFILGLSSYDGGKPVIWDNGKTEELPFNGYITSIGIYP